MTSENLPWFRAAIGANLIGSDGQLGRTVFEEITALAMEHQAINLGQGFPDTEGPTQIRDIAIKAIASGENQYAPGSGIPVLRQAIADHQALFYGLSIDPDTDVVVTTGATEAIAAAVLAFAQKGDEVVSFEPFYDSYGAMISLSGATHKVVPLKAPGFQPDLDQLCSVVNDKTKLIILNNPHNPTGAVFGVEVLSKIIELAERHDCLIISDEVYEHLTFGVPHIPIATLPGGFERTVTISSAGKSFSFTGWKVGWASGPADLIAAVRTVKQFLSYSSGPAFQQAVAQALGLPERFHQDFAKDLGDRGTLLANGLEGAGLDVMRPQGTYFLIADLAPWGISNAVELARRLPVQAGVAAIPLSVFCHSQGQAETASLLRFAFCKKPSVLHQAVERLQEYSRGLV